MKFTVSTGVLQSLVAKAMKGASNNKMLPLTNFIEIECKDNILTLTTTDSTNYLYLYEELIGDNEDFSVVVGPNIFSKLISKLTCEVVSLSVDNDKLVVDGNGKYNIELPLDEEGRLLKFPQPLKTVDVSNPLDTITLDTINVMLGTAKNSLAVSLDIPCYTCYYAGDSIITTDTYKMCGINKKLFATPKLLRPEFVELLSIISLPDIKTYIDGDSIVCHTDNCTVYGKLMDCIDDYQIGAINDILQTQFSSSGTISTQLVSQVLDRLSLFVGVYDRGEIKLTFDDRGIIITSKQSTGIEVVPFITKENVVPFNVSVNVNMLQDLVNAIKQDTFKISYGNTSSIMLSTPDVVQVLALISEY